LLLLALVAVAAPQFAQAVFGQDAHDAIRSQIEYLERALEET
jgi:hypothetical protein